MLSDIKKWLSQKGIRVSDSWLDGCINFFLSQDENMHLKTLQNNVLEQWTLADLSDIGVPCLPKLNVRDPHAKREAITGHYVVQLVSILDISVPAMTQLEKIYRLPKQFLEDELKDCKSSRVLKLKLTDGTNTIEATEIQPINCLKCTLKPGTKICLKGPIEVGFNGVLFLEENNISVLGGEVDNLLESNSLISTLWKSIGFTTENNPFQNRFVCMDIPQKVNNETPEEIANCNKIDFFSEEFDANLGDLILEPEVAKRSLNILDPNYAIKIHNIPLVFIRELNEVCTKIISEMNFIVIVQIEEVIEKLCIRNGSWQNLVRLGDFLFEENPTSDDTINVKIHSDVITKFVGYSVAEMLNLQNQIDNPTVNRDIINRLGIMKQLFENTIYLANIKIAPYHMQPIPVLVNLEEYKDEHRETVDFKRNFGV